jgi:hypothetical protein
METFNSPESFVMQGKHKIAPPTLTLDDAKKPMLSTDAIYAVEVNGWNRVAVFRRWHGVHALFYSPKDDCTMAVYYNHLPKRVKEIE